MDNKTKKALQQVYDKLSSMSDDELHCEMEKMICSGGLEYTFLYIEDPTMTWDKYMSQCMKWFKYMWE